ncbi:MAG: gfo/Idh/MocA family oxidoreductase, partial [Planctomycetota bacterium]
RRWEFGNGVLGDMGSHLIDLAFWALELQHPVEVESEGPPVNDVACPPWQQVTWRHAARPGGGPHRAACKVVWYHGEEGMKRRAAYLQPLVGSDANIDQWGIGVAFVGSEGAVIADYGKIVLSPGDRFKNQPRPEPSIPKSLGHYREWIHAAKTGGATLCNFDYSGRLIEHNLLGNVAHRCGHALDWNPGSFAAENAPGSGRFVTKRYRDGWSPRES